MDVLHILYCVIIIIVAVLVDPLLGDREYMVKESENYIVPLNYKTKITCEMNIVPDNFEWRFYPLPEREAFNDKAVINLGLANYTMISPKAYSSQKLRSSLNINLGNDTHAAGDYQCLAHYGASVVASVPWRLTIARIDKLSGHKPTVMDVMEGNTVSWRCEPPNSSPQTSIDYYYKNKILVSSNLTNQNTSLIISNVQQQNSGIYTCVANNMILNVNYTLNTLELSVNNHHRLGPTFIVEPKRVYIVNKGDSIFMECSAIGNPKPNVSWRKKDGKLPRFRSELVNGGFEIRNIQASDDGVYICTHVNDLGTVTHEVTLIYNEEPSIDCYLNNTDVKQGENLDLSCEIKGTPEPIVSWFLNGKSVINDTKIEAVGNKIYFRPIEKRHAGNLQCFASNRVETNYKSISIIVIPLSTSVDISITTTQPRQKHNGRKNNGNRKSSKHMKMVPPSKPVVSRLTDESVLVRWNVTANNGLPIQFFKVQYSELEGHNEHRKKGSWKTNNADISPHLTCYEVNNLKPDHYYKFRIAAVYSNNDNKRSINSDKFLLTRADFDKRNPLPIPLITGTESVNSTTVKIYWNFTQSSNITVKGFFINYLSASSAADYMKVTVDGAEVNSFELSHLQPDSVYDIKMQSFTSESASDFSAIMKARTSRKLSPPTVVTTTQSSHAVTNHTTNPDNGGISTLHIIIAGSAIGGALLISTVALFFICKKWKKKKNAGDRDKPTVNVDHHIQNDGNDYVVSSKSIPRTNGCALPPNRITITANPLADADSKTQNMIEMSCLTSQNNNCALSTQTQQPSVSGQDVPAQSTDRSKNKMKNREKIKRTKHNVDTAVSGENYV